MIRLGSMTGLPVVLTGRMMGRVEQAVLTRDGRALRGIVVRHGLGSARWVDNADVRIIGGVSVIVGRKPCKLPGDADFSLSGVNDTGGMHLGYVTDVYLNPVTRRVTALEVSLGPAESWRCGRMLARDYVVKPTPEDPGQVLIPCGCALERPRETEVIE